jgi:hypothetical protein
MDVFKNECHLECECDWWVFIHDVSEELAAPFKKLDELLDVSLPATNYMVLPEDGALCSQM